MELSFNLGDEIQGKQLDGNNRGKNTGTKGKRTCSKGH
jgi:hypothetical protein